MKPREAEEAAPSTTSRPPSGGGPVGAARTAWRSFFGWRVLAGGFGLQFMLSTLMSNSFGAYVAVLRDSEGWSKTALSGVAALHQVEGALLGPLQGWVVDRYGTRGVVRAGLLMFAGGLMLLGTTSSLVTFYAVFLLIALGLSLAGFLTLSVGVINWFDRYRARALSMLSMGVAVSGFAAPVVAWALQTYGWRRTAFASGVIALVVGWPLSHLLHRRPEDFGQQVDGEPAAPAGGGMHAGDAAPTQGELALESLEGAEPPRRCAPATAFDHTWREALRAPAFWLISFGHGSALLVVGAVNVHAVTHIKEGLGYTLAQAALMVSAQTAAQVVGILTAGALGDAWDKRRVSAACMLLHGFGLVLLAYATRWEPVLGAALLHGFAWGLRGPLMQAMRADHFGRKSIGTIMGMSMPIVLVGQILGPMIAGVMADASGHYRLAFTILGVFAMLGSLFFLLVPKVPMPPGAAATQPA